MIWQSMTKLPIRLSLVLIKFMWPASTPCEYACAYYLNIGLDKHSAVQVHVHACTPNCTYVWG